MKILTKNIEKETKKNERNNIYIHTHMNISNLDVFNDKKKNNDDICMIF